MLFSLYIQKILPFLTLKKQMKQALEILTPLFLHREWQIEDGGFCVFIVIISSKSAFEFKSWKYFEY